jgi:TBC1 domain family protein 5
MAELKKLQQKIGDSLEWILETLSQEDESESAVLRKRQALESLAYAKNILKGSVVAVDDARLLDGGVFKGRVGGQESIPATGQGLSTNSPTVRLEGIATSQNDIPERPRGLGHSSSSPSLNRLSAQLSPGLPRTPWTPVHDKPASADLSTGSAPPKPQRRSVSFSSRPIETETSAKPPIQHDPLGVL